LVRADRLAELRALVGVLRRGLDRRLRDARRASAGLQAARGEAAHLQVEALALAADQVLRGHEVAVDLHREGVHAAVAGRAVGLARDRAAAGLTHDDLVSGERVLRHDEQRQALGALRGVGIGAGELRDHVRAPGERAPRLRTGEEPAGLAVELAL